MWDSIDSYLRRDPCTQRWLLVLGLLVGILSQNSLLRVDLRGEVIEMYKDPMVLNVF